jgi:hypothetical protein
MADAWWLWLAALFAVSSAIGVVAVLASRRRDARRRAEPASKPDGEPAEGAAIDWRTRYTVGGSAAFAGTGFFGGVFGLGAGFANVPGPGHLDMSREQIAHERYASWLEMATGLAFNASLAAFVACAAGLLPASVPLEALPVLWHVPAADYLARTGAPAGWGWLRLLPAAGGAGGSTDRRAARRRVRDFGRRALTRARLFGLQNP